MELNELRHELDVLDAGLIELLEKRMDIAASVAAYKASRGLPVLDAAREAEKLSSVRAQCRPETANGIADVFTAIMTASRAHQASLMEAEHGA